MQARISQPMEVTKRSNTTESKLPQYKDFRLYLQAELAERCAKNPSYSLRSFAKSLNIHHSALSRILRGQRGISRQIFDSLTQSLNLPPTAVANFAKSMRFEHSGTEQDFADLALDTFAMMADWYHDAILECMHLKDFEQEPKWLAKKLGITVGEANTAVERLIRLGLIAVNDDGIWESRAEHTELGIDSSFTTTALKTYQKKILSMAIESIDAVPRERRHNISTTIAVDMKDMEEIKKRTNEFRRKLSKFIQRKDTNPTEVYEMGICFYPVTNKDGSK